MEVTVTVNGSARSNEVEPRTLLVHHIRDELGYTGTNVGCDTSSCGACTVHVDGRAVKSCTMLAVQANGADITTIEGLAETARAAGIATGDQNWHPMQEAFQQCHGLQCGYCTPGMVMAAVSLLDNANGPDIDLTEGGIDEAAVREGLEGNLCRCTGYHNIVKAVLSVAGGAE
jgi:aerobic-type carbon monoxide dehydrogenase small subunit (CoxS/CutS family)